MKKTFISGCVLCVLLCVMLAFLSGAYQSFPQAIVYTGDGSGLVRGGMSFINNTDTTTLNSAAKVQIVDFDTSDESSLMTVNTGTDDITTLRPGDYWCAIYVSVMNNASQQHTIYISVWKNNGATEFFNVHAERDVSGGVPGDTGSMSGGGLIRLEVGDTVEVWATTSDAGDRSVTFKALTLTLFMIGC